MRQLSTAEMADFHAELRNALPLSARTGIGVRAAYTSDASNYRLTPAAVVEPRHVDEVAVAIGVATRFGLPVVPRGGGTSIAGNAISTGLVIDFSRHLDRVLELDPGSRLAVVQPGVVLDTLQAQAARHGLAFGPDPSTHSRCTLGGMIGNNACGSHSVAWGSTADNVEALRVLTAGGTVLDVRGRTTGEAALDHRLEQLASDNLAVLRTELGRFRRQVSGYALHHLLPENKVDIARALVGSEGTCGVLLEATVSLVSAPPHRALAVLAFDTVYEAAEAAPELSELDGVLTAEGMDDNLVAALMSRPPAQRSDVDLLPPGGAWLMVETGGQSVAEAAAAATRIAAHVGPHRSRILTEAASMRALWRVREEGAGIATRMVDGSEAWPGWEDAAVEPKNLAAYLRDFHALMGEHDRRGTVYGHFGEGCLHVRVDWDLTTADGVAAYRRFIEDAADLVASHGGSMSGEHGDGRARSELLPRMYSPAALAAFRSFKAIFDPANTLNPGVLVDPAPLDADIRAVTGRTLLGITPVQALSSDGGSLSAALRRCVGVGKCRRPDSGAMCPSYIATRDEVHSTRGRARVLSEMLAGDVISDGWRSTEVRDALDLCLSCKACANDCPAGVDMATYKAEFLHHHYAKRLRPLSHYSMGWLPLWLRIGALAPRLGNAVTRRPWLSSLLKRIGGIDRQRSLPELSPEPFTRWFRRRAKARADSGEPTGQTVVLWPDTFNTYLSPEVLSDTVVVLEALGYRVELPARSVCCGLTWHSTGQLKIARRVLRRTLDVLGDHLERGHLIVGAEPSCTAALREAGELLPGDPRAELLRNQLSTLAELVEPHADKFASLSPGKAIAQVHCHQRASSGFGADHRVLAGLGLDVSEVGEGCCGLAGNFGFEKGHYDLSQTVAEHSLYPAVREASPDTLVLADGYSCRVQVEQGTERSATHLAQVLRRALGPGDSQGR